MKRFQLSFLVLLGMCFTLQAQVLLQEDFESGDLPADWSIQTNASDGGWVVGTPGQVSSQAWNVASNGSSQLIATNDDACNCDKSEDILVTPAIDLTDVDVAVVRFDIFYGAQTYQGDTEEAAVVASTDGANWQVLQVLEGGNGWESRTVNLSAFGGESVVYVGFQYNDNGGWLYGMAIDNISIEVPDALDAELVKLNGRAFGEENEDFPITAQFFNAGGNTINDLEVTYSIGGGAPTVENFTGVDAAPFTNFDLELPNPWVPTMSGIVEVTMEITAVNGQIDANTDNNSASFETEIFAKVVAPNLIDEFLMAPPVTVDIDVPSSQLDKPNDLAFFPILGKDELWVVNQRNESIGGSTLTLNDVSTDDPELLHRVDGNAWHFMSLPTGIDFSPENFNFGTSPGVKDANHSGGTFTGPTLWSSDPEIYAQPSGGNGSHLDMLHGSPFSMGIAHEVDNVFWIYDDWNSDIVRYDFVEDHGPGNDDHSDAIIRRYKGIGIESIPDVPNHMVLDKATGWLYFVDNGNGRVMRLDINSGNNGGNLPLINEPLAEHSEVVNFTVETIIDEGLDQACGIEIMENRLLVSDFATGEIIVYDMEDNFLELGRILTAEGAGITGITIGPNGGIWYVNRTQRSLSRLEPGEPSSAEEDQFVSQVRVSPNPTSGALFVRLPELPTNAEINMRVTDLAGQMHLNLQGASLAEDLDLSRLANGFYLLTIQADEFSVTKKIVVKK